MLIKNKCLKSLKCLIIFYFIISLFVTSFCQLDEKDLQIKNLIEREKEISSQQGEEFDLKRTDRYSINSQIMRYYNNNTEIYISIIDPGIANKLTFSEINFKENYFDSYEKILGATHKFFPILDWEILNTTHVEIKDGEVVNLSYKNKSEILLHIIEDSNNNKFYLMRNIFFNNLDNPVKICKNKENILRNFNSEIKFYDVNLILNCHENIFNLNEAILWEKENFVYASRYIIFENDTKILYDYFTTQNNSIKTKISRKRILNQKLKKILNKKVSYVNLKNFLTEQILLELNQMLNSIIRDIVMIDNYFISYEIDEEKFDGKINNLDEKLNYFIQYLEGFNLDLTNRPSYFIYYIIIAILISISFWTIFITIKEMKESYSKKIT